MARLGPLMVALVAALLPGCALAQGFDPDLLATQTSTTVTTTSTTLTTTSTTLTTTSTTLTTTSTTLTTTSTTLTTTSTTVTTTTTTPTSNLPEAPGLDSEEDVGLGGAGWLAVLLAALILLCCCLPGLYILYRRRLLKKYSPGVDLEDSTDDSKKDSKLSGEARGSEEVVAEASCQANEATATSQWSIRTSWDRCFIPEADSDCDLPIIEDPRDVMARGCMDLDASDVVDDSIWYQGSEVDMMNTWRSWDQSGTATHRGAEGDGNHASSASYSGDPNMAGAMSMAGSMSSKGPSSNGHAASPSTGLPPGVVGTTSTWKWDAPPLVEQPVQAFPTPRFAIGQDIEEVEIDLEDAAPMASTRLQL